MMKEKNYEDIKEEDNRKGKKKARGRMKEKNKDKDREEQSTGFH